MEGCYKVEENINFEAFLRAMGVTDDVAIEKMIQATKQVTLKDNGNGTWTQISGLKTSTFPLDKEYKESWGEKELTGFVTMDGSHIKKTYKLGDVEVFTEDVQLEGNNLILTLYASDGTKAVRKMTKI